MKSLISSKSLFAIVATFAFVGLTGVTAHARPYQGPVMTPAGSTGTPLPEGYGLRSHGGHYIVPTSWTPGDYGRRGTTPYYRIATRSGGATVTENYFLRSSHTPYYRALKSEAPVGRLPERGYALRSHGGHYIAPAQAEFKYTMHRRGPRTN